MSIFLSIKALVEDGVLKREIARRFGIDVRTVRKDCHIAIDQNHYSVPYVHVGQEVLVRIGEEQITVYADGAVVATHSRSRDRGRTITDLEHYPKHTGKTHIALGLGMKALERGYARSRRRTNWLARALGRTPPEREHRPAGGSRQMSNHQSLLS